MNQKFFDPEEDGEEPGEAAQGDINEKGSVANMVS
jgi:hypothetical protein